MVANPYRLVGIILAAVGAVMAPTNGAGGIGGCEFTKTFSDGIDRHPDELVTVNE